MKRSFSLAYGKLHLAVLLYGFTAILGSLISLSGTVLVWHRMLLTLGSLCLFPGVFRQVAALPRRELLRIAGIGMLITLHWITFYEAIKYSNASITLSCLASTSFLTALIEPLFFRQPLRRQEMLLGAAVVLGIALIFGFAGGRYLTGILIALLSALLIALAGVLNKDMVGRHPVNAITWVEFAAGLVFLSAVLPLYFRLFPAQQGRFWPSPSDWAWLVVLAFACTTLAYTLTMQALREVSAFTATLAINLEPVYGIVLAYVILGEGAQMDAGFYAGAAIIVGAVFVHGWLGRR